MSVPIAIVCAVANSYTVLWTNDLCRELIRGSYTGQRPSMLFGGPHQSRPSFRRAGVVPGDRVFAVRVHRTALYLVCAMQVQRIVDYADAGAELADEDYPRLTHWRPLKSGCISEVVLGTPGTPIPFDAPVAGEPLERLTFTSRRGERQLKYVEDGRLLRSVSLEGIYRLAPDSADILTSQLTPQDITA
ncbi:hypothetical protein EDD99_4066 [Streptomyces sp. 846.5]|nr:hypothetical protein EDD99_4066 [Streptomyces sp. 846.5]